MSEHLFGIHNSDPEVQDYYREEIKKTKGAGVYAKLRILKWQTWSDINLIKIYLENEWRKLENEKA